MKRNKINTGWNAIPQKKEKKQKRKISWIAKYEANIHNENTIFEKIVKFLIQISLLLTINRKNLLNHRKKNEIINATYESLSSDKFTFIPAGVGLYFFLSLIPIFIFSISLIRFFPGWYELLTKDVLSYIFPGFDQMFKLIDFNNTAFNIVFIFFIVSLVWFGSKGIAMFSDSFISIYDYDYATNWIVKRFKAILTVVVISLFFTCVSLTYLPLLEIIKNSFKENNAILYEFLFYLTLTLYLFVFGYIGIGTFFIFIPPFKLKWKQIKPGILTSLVPTILFIVLFGLITKYLNYEKFGTIGTFIYSLIFILYVSYFLHAGIIVNASYYKTFFSSTMSRKKIILSKKIAFFVQNIYKRFKK